jgi:two-component sensor histidine kinase/integral membrane sensor domain MASE1
VIRVAATSLRAFIHGTRSRSRAGSERINKEQLALPSALRSVDREQRNRQLKTDVIRLLGVGLAYFALASLGLQLASVHPSATPIWPATGFAIAAILLWGYRIAPAILVAAFAVNQLTAGSVFTSIAIASGNTLEALLAGFLVALWAGGIQVFSTPTGIAKFGLISLAATAVSASIGVGSLAVAGYAEPSTFTSIWLTWWLGDLAGALVVAPVVLLWGRSEPSSFTTRQITKTLTTALSAVAVGILAFSPWVQQTPARDALAFLAVPPLLWTALRGSTRDTATVVLIISTFAVWGTLMNGGPFARPTLNDALIVLVVFMISTALLSLALSAEVSVRRRIEKQQRQRALEAEVLWQATNQVASGGSFEDLLRGCLERICRVTGWPVGHAYLPDDVSAPSRLKPSSVWHFEREELASLAEDLADALLSHGEGLPGEIWATGKSQWVPDVERSQNLPRKAMLLQHGLNAAFGFPLYVEGQLQAVLEFFSTARQPPDRHLLYIVQSIGEQLGRVLERQRAHEQQSFLLRELSHRVGNSLAVLQSVFRRSLKHASSFQELEEGFEGRLMSLAAAHRLLSESGWESTSLHKLALAAVKPYCSAKNNCDTIGDDTRIPTSMVLSLSMVLHELATNAAKHGAFKSKGGKVRIEWKRHRPMTGAECLQLKWQEQGVPNSSKVKREGYGTMLIDSTVSAFGGTITRNFGADGFSIELSFPLN